MDNLGGRSSTSCNRSSTWAGWLLLVLLIILVIIHINGHRTY